jgi:hypothetical protein
VACQHPPMASLRARLSKGVDRMDESVYNNSARVQSLLGSESPKHINRYEIP